jgi:hypothetical protein
MFYTASRTFLTVWEGVVEASRNRWISGNEKVATASALPSLSANGFTAKPMCLAISLVSRVNTTLSPAPLKLTCKGITIDTHTSRVVERM